MPCWLGDPPLRVGEPADRAVVEPLPVVALEVAVDGLGRHLPPAPGHQAADQLLAVCRTDSEDTHTD